MHFRYSSVLMQVFVAFTHGLAIPMLFPITILGILNSYIAEKLQFAYFYKQPPLLDNELNYQALTLLIYAPIIFLMKSYWLLGNTQMFFDGVTPIIEASEIMNPKHFLFDLTNGVNSTLMILIFLPIFIFNQYHKMYA
jgi:hypothetical protein